jgi:Icc-related predicted phosphoesterase
MVLPVYLLKAQNYYNTKGGLVFVSDIQAPLWLETITSKNEYNEIATDSLFDNINRSKPEAVFMLGDLVGQAINHDNWKDLDRRLKALRKSKIPVFAIPGNHEYMFIAEEGEKKFRNRFPYLPINGFYQVYDSIGIIMLNSNFSKMKNNDFESQRSFYKKILDSMDNDKKIKSIIVCCHHSPYSNSKVVGSDIEVQTNFVKPFLSSRKTSIFISGHSHNLEHFEHHNKHFLVIGGGGGPKQALEQKGHRKWNDKLNDDDKPRFFYLQMNKEYNNLIVNVMGLNQNFTKLISKEILSITLD